MSPSAVRSGNVSRRKPLATCVAALFALASPIAMAANTWTVNSCSDANSGGGFTGTLRYAAANALSGDTIDMTSIGCSTISLGAGDVVFNQNNIYLNGPGAGSLLISGKYDGSHRIFTHNGTGKFGLHDLTLAAGYVNVANGAARGGCVYSQGIAALYHVNVYSCTAHSQTGGRAAGGAVYGKTGVVFAYGILSGNSAASGSLNGAYGGAIYSRADATLKYSTVSGNTAGPRGFGGGLFVYASADVTFSTISGNTAGDNGGGLYTYNFFNSGSISTTINNSTVSGNHANYYTGGVSTNAHDVYLYNSSIVFNTAAKGRFGAAYPFTYRAPGFATKDGLGPMNVRLYSMLMADNTYGSTEYDLSVPTRASTSVTFSGSHNLVRATFAAVPGDTIKISCPLLGSLRNNGGPTQTHALLSKSPGIDQGLNKKSFVTDQRGVGFARASPTGMPDIGAYEVQQGDIVFDANFEGCPVLF